MRLCFQIVNLFDDFTEVILILFLGDVSLDCVALKLLVAQNISELLKPLSLPFLVLSGGPLFEMQFLQSRLCEKRLEVLNGLPHLSADLVAKSCDLGVFEVEHLVDSHLTFKILQPQSLNLRNEKPLIRHAFGIVKFKLGGIFEIYYTLGIDQLAIKSK